ncbi:MAG TPA: amidohydrolase [Desulfurococcales archaeon]|nr:amidohydrolase [Desulfurococcales archaeon]
MILRRCKYIITQDYSRRILKDKDILIQDGIIVEIGENIRGDDEVIDCSDKIVMPGLINAHTHSAMVLMRGFYDDAELDEWLRKIWSLERKLTPRIIRLAAKAAIYEMLANGITGFLDMYFYPEEVAQVAKELGIRVKLGYTIMDKVSTTSLDRRLKEVEEFILKYRNDPLVKPVINIHSIYTCTKNGIIEGYNLARKYNVDIHIHVSETRREVYECKKEYNVFPVEYLNMLGVLSENMILVHLGWITSWEIELISRCNCKVVHCPTSNMKLATGGILPLLVMLDKGITVGLGTDSAASNNSLDMFIEMKNTILLQRHSFWSVDVKAQHALDLATINGARILGIKSGRIMKGYLADIIALNANELNLNPLREDNLISAIVYSATGLNVEFTIVNGRLVYSREFRDRIVRELQTVYRELNEFILKHSLS